MYVDSLEKYTLPSTTNTIDSSLTITIYVSLGPLSKWITYSNGNFVFKPKEINVGEYTIDITLKDS